MAKEYDDDIIGWFTWNGMKLPIRKDKSKSDVIKEHINKTVSQNEDAKDKQIKKHQDERDRLNGKSTVDKEKLNDFINWLKKEEQSRNKAYHDSDVIKVDGKWVKNTSDESKALYKKLKEIDTTDGFSDNVRADYEKATNTKLSDAEWKQFRLVWAKIK